MRVFLILALLFTTNLYAMNTTVVESAGMGVGIGLTSGTKGGKLLGKNDQTPEPQKTVQRKIASESMGTPVKPSK